LSNFYLKNKDLCGKTIKRAVDLGFVTEEELKEMEEKAVTHPVSEVLPGEAKPHLPPQRITLSGSNLGGKRRRERGTLPAVVVGRGTRGPPREIFRSTTIRETVEFFSS
jgi:hypothetical protein